MPNSSFTVVPIIRPQDPSQTLVTRISPDKVQERVASKYEWSSLPFAAPARARYDVIIVGGGHNGLVAAAYLAKNGQSVLVLERRHIVGGAAVTEELVPGFKFSRASYLAGLLRPRIIKELQLEKFGFKYLVRDPSSFTPTKQAGRYLMMGADEQRTLASIAQFSAKDARAYVEYERFLKQVHSSSSMHMIIVTMNLGAQHNCAFARLPAALPPARPPARAPARLAHALEGGLCCRTQHVGVGAFLRAAYCTCKLRAGQMVRERDAENDSGH